MLAGARGVHTAPGAGHLCAGSDWRHGVVTQPYRNTVASQATRGYRKSMPTSVVLLTLASRLRAERERQGITLDELARRTGLSKPHLSRIESGDRQPAIATLLGLAEALDVRVGRLLGEDDDGPSIGVHGPDAPTHEVNGLEIASAGGYRGSRELEALRITVTGDRRDVPFVQHHGEEWIYVLSGALHLDHDGVTHQLHAGTSAHFDASRPHRLRAPDGPAALALVTTATIGSLAAAHA